jgi:hypothetical protein
VAGASHHAAAVERLLEAMRMPDWVAEEPEVHLVPHIREALAAPGATLRVDGFETAAHGELVVRLRDSRPAAQRTPAGLRAAAFALAGSFGETSTFVQERRDGARVEFLVVTGLLEGRFTPHGHVVRLVVEG